MLSPMTPQDLNDGVQMAVDTAHRLHRVLRRKPAVCEIRWRLATEFQRRWPSMVRRDAVRMANKVMRFVSHAVT